MVSYTKINCRSFLIHKLLMFLHNLILKSACSSGFIYRRCNANGHWARMNFTQCRRLKESQAFKNGQQLSCNLTNTTVSSITLAPRAAHSRQSARHAMECTTRAWNACGRRATPQNAAVRNKPRRTKHSKRGMRHAACGKQQTERVVNVVFSFNSYLPHVPKDYIVN